MATIDLPILKAPASLPVLCFEWAAIRLQLSGLDNQTALRWG